MNFRTSPRSTPRSRQHGNTIIGIVIGLVIGLSIAVVVALVINKGSTPFTDKGRSSKAAEPTAGQSADPNKPMYGNKEAAPQLPPRPKSHYFAAAVVVIAVFII